MGKYLEKSRDSHGAICRTGEHSYNWSEPYNDYCTTINSATHYRAAVRSRARSVVAYAVALYCDDYDIDPILYHDDTDYLIEQSGNQKEAIASVRALGYAI